MGGSVVMGERAGLQFSLRQSGHTSREGDIWAKTLKNCQCELCGYWGNSIPGKWLGQMLWAEDSWTVKIWSLVSKAMAPHSSILAWKIPWTEEPGRLQSMGSRRVRRDWATSLSLFTFMLWRRKWQPTPVFLPGESQGWGSLVGCRLWGRTESDTTEVT